MHVAYTIRFTCMQMWRLNEFTLEVDDGQENNDDEWWQNTNWRLACC